MRQTGSPVSKSMGVKGEPDAMARVWVQEEGKQGGPRVRVFLGRGACLFYKHRVQISIGAGLLSAIWGGCPPTLEALGKNHCVCSPAKHNHWASLITARTHVSSVRLPFRDIIAPPAIRVSGGS